MPRLFPRLGARGLVLAIATLAITMFLPAQVAQAAAATHLTLVNVDSTATANRTIDSVSVHAQDGSNADDATFAGSVSFSAACGNCFAVSVNADMSSAQPGNNNSYQFNPVFGDFGSKTFYVEWNEAGVGTQTLHVASGGITAADANTSTAVASNNPTKLVMTGPQSSGQQNVPETVTVAMHNHANQTNPNPYTGTVTFSASCSDCFTITPNNGAGHLDEYTYVTGDNSTKNFSLTWTTTGTGRTFTAQGTDLADVDTATKNGISVVAGPTTTTSSSTTSTSTTSTTVVPRQKAAMVVTGAAQGGGPHVIARDANTGAVVYSFMAYTPAFTGGVRVATGDVNGDGWDDIITGAGPGGGPEVRVLSGKDLAVLADFYAYAPTFTGGVFVAAGDVNHDGKADVITGADAGGGAHVRAFDATKLTQGADAAQLLGFMAYDNFSGGVRVASADFNGDGHDDIVTGAGPGGGPHVRFWSGTNGAELGGAHGFFAYAPSFSGGVYVAASDAQTPVVITGAGAGGGRHVRVLDIHGTEDLGFMADTTSTQGAVPAIGRANTLANDDFYVSRATGNPAVQQFSITDGHQIAAFPAYQAGVGVFVAVGVF
ncbi:MAG TPA: VCBS repeat-containing protein [Acidimicrobiales bacterium]|nr:VCBS repeat-containing protein [Acidimicrobiales bacterium]